MTLLDIAHLFSIGQFHKIDHYFSDQITWEIIGEQQLNGLHAVLAHCTQIRAYFDSIQHEFTIDQIHQNKNICIVQGHACFFSSSNTTKISACDIYTFDSSEKLQRIQSYCIKIR